LSSAAGASEYTTNMITLAPEISYFVADNISLGAICDFLRYTSKYPGDPDYTETITKILLCPRYVAEITAENVYPFVGALGGIFSSADNDTPKEETDGTVFGGEAGVKLRVCESGMLNIKLQYLKTSGTRTYWTDIDYDESDMKLLVGFTLFR